MAEAAAPSDCLTVDNYNWHLVKGDVPKLGLQVLTLVARDTPIKYFPLSSIVDAVSNCDVIVRFVDTFYTAANLSWDTSRLRILNSGRGLKIRKFYGHLDQTGIALLPEFVYELGLAIGSAKDAEAISNLQLWPALREIRVSVTPRVGLEHLRLLPGVMQRGVLFPGLTDDRVCIVEPAIVALVPSKRLSILNFPKAQLSATGAQYLVETIRDMDGLYIDFEIVIEACGAWKPNEEEEEKFKEMLKDRVTLQKITWNMSWIYEA